jgi:hypothetical protein
MKFSSLGGLVDEMILFIRTSIFVLGRSNQKP